MLKMTVGISQLIRFIERKLVKFRLPNGGISRKEEQQVIELLILRFICRDESRIRRLSSPTVLHVFNRLTKGDRHTSGDIELLDELYYYGELVGDVVMRYFDYEGDGIGYNCRIHYNLRRRRISIEGTSECLRERLGR